MAKINTLTVEGTKKDGYKVTAMLDDGAIVEIKEGFEFTPAGEVPCTSEQVADYERRLSEKDDEVRTIMYGHELKQKEIESLQAEIGSLQQELAKRPETVRAPLMHVEHQDIPTSRKIDDLAPLDALAPAPVLPDPDQYRLDLDPDAPARPPRPGELARVHSPIEQVGDVDGRTQEAHALLNDVERRRLDQISKEPTRDPLLTQVATPAVVSPVQAVDERGDWPKNTKLTDDDANYNER